MRLHGALFIYHGKWPFYRRKLPQRVWPDIPEINLPWEISMVTSKRAKKPLMTLNLVNAKVFRFQISFRFLQHETPQNCFFKRVSFALFRWKKEGLLRQNFELVCWDRFRNDISPKFVLSLVSNRWMQLNCKIELCTFAKLSWITYQLKFYL